MERSRSGIGFGIFILTIGILWILANTGVITWSIVNALFVLWPLILVLIGVNIIFRRNEIIKALVWIAFLAILVSYSYFFDGRGISDKNMAGGRVTAVDMQPETQKGELKLAFGGIKINLDSSTSNISKLLEPDLQDPNIKQSVDNRDNNRTVSIVFEKSKYWFTNFNFGNSYNSRFHLNNAVVWDLDIDTGALDGTFDMSGLKVEKFSLDMGAANLKLIMGSYNTSMKINAGVSKMDIEIPQDTGMKVKIDGGLNNTNLNEKGWEKRGDGYYYSPDFDQKSKAYHIVADVSMGVSNLSVNTR